LLPWLPRRLLQPLPQRRTPLRDVMGKVWADGARATIERTRRNLPTARALLPACATGGERLAHNGVCP
jgi:hypothetical protein